MAVQEQTIHQSQSSDGVIEVRQHHTIRSLYLGSDAKQSCIDVSEPKRLVLRYTQAMMLPLIIEPTPTKALFVGLGGGAMPSFLHSHTLDCKIDIIEQREDVLKIAYGYFGLPTSDNIKIHIKDGLEYLASRTETEDKYDFIFIDAYDHAGMPSTLKTEAFFNFCRTHLADTGICAFNLWRNEDQGFHATITNLLKAFPKSILQLPIEGRGNVVILAAPMAQQFSNLKQYSPQAKYWETKTNVPFENLLRQLRRSNRWRWLNLFS